MNNICKAAALALLVIQSVDASPISKAPKAKKAIRVSANHWSRPRSLERRDDGSVALTNVGGGWTLPVLVGGQQMIQNIDTGSADL